MEDTLCERLGHEQLLLVLDNCEHLVPEVADLTTRLLESCPQVQVLNTSQAPIGVPGEALLVMEPLELPSAAGGDEAEAVRLFLDRAVLVRPDFSPGDRDLAAIARVCRRLDGIPLAIELAASRLNVLSLAQLEERLDQRFALLTGTGHRSARQRTLRATVEWSFDLLAPKEQRAWIELSVFIGGFDLEAAAFLLGVDEIGALDALAVLVDRSILHTSPREDGIRYRMLETMREFGRERLVAAGELADSRARQRAWMLDLAARAVPEHMTNEGPAWHNRFDLEYPNLRFAIESGLDDGHPVDSLRLCADLGLFFWLRGHLAQGREWCERSLAAASEADEELRARGLLSLGELAFGQLDFDASCPPLEEAVELATSVGDEASVGWAHMFLAAIYANRGDLERAIASRDEALRVAENHVIPSVTAGAYYWVGAVNAVLGDQAGAATYLDRAVELARDVGSPYTLARYLPLIARRLHVEGDHEAAMTIFEEAIDISRKAGDRVGLARSLQFMAERNVLSGDYEMAIVRLDEAQPIISREIDDPTLACRVELTWATLWRHRGDLDLAQSHVEHALAWAAGLKGWRTTLDPSLVQAEVAFDSGDTDRALDSIAVSLDQAREANHSQRLTRALLFEARVLATIGDIEGAETSLAEAEALFGQSVDRMVLAQLDGVRGQIALVKADPAHAAEMFERAVNAASLAGAALLSIECSEDLALALAEVDPSDQRVARLRADAEARRAELDTPLPQKRQHPLIG